MKRIQFVFIATDGEEGTTAPLPKKELSANAQATLKAALAVGFDALEELQDVSEVPEVLSQLQAGFASYTPGNKPTIAQFANDAAVLIEQIGTDTGNAKAEEATGFLATIGQFIAGGASAKLAVLKYLFTKHTTPTA